MLNGPANSRSFRFAAVFGAKSALRAAASTAESGLAEAALAAAKYTARRQQSDGSWLYGESKYDCWVDNFHTGFVLVALKRIAVCLRTDEFDDAIARGYSFWKDCMFQPDGAPKFYPDKVYPIDIHCVAQAILTFLEFADRDAEASACAGQVVVWGIEHMQDAEGYFHYQIHRRYRIHIPYMRWSQAWMLRALAEYQWAKAGEQSTQSRRAYA